MLLLFQYKLYYMRTRQLNPWAIEPKYQCKGSIPTAANSGGTRGLHTSPSGSRSKYGCVSPGGKLPDKNYCLPRNENRLYIEIFQLMAKPTDILISKIRE